MANASDTSIYQVNTPVTLIHPHVIDPAPFKEKGKTKGDPVYSASFVFPANHPDLPDLKSLILSVAKAKWPGCDVIADVKAGKLRMPFTSGEKVITKAEAKVKATGKEYDGKRDEYLKGAIVFKTKSNYPPGLGVVAGGQVVEVTSDNKALHKGAFYFGTDCLCRLNFVAYEGEAIGSGVTCYLDMVVSLNRGKRLSGSKSPAEVFKGVAGLVSTEDPTGGADELSDEIPF